MPQQTQAQHRRRHPKRQRKEELKHKPAVYLRCRALRANVGEALETEAGRSVAEADRAEVEAGREDSIAVVARAAVEGVAVVVDRGARRVQSYGHRNPKPVALNRSLFGPASPMGLEQKSPADRNSWKVWKS